MNTPPWKYLLEKLKKYMHLLNQIHAMYCWEGLLVIQHFWRSDFFKRCWISSSISQTISKNAQKKKWWLFFFYSLCINNVFCMIISNYGVNLLWCNMDIPHCLTKWSKRKKNDHKHIAVSSTLCNTPYRWFFFSTVNFKVRKFQARPLGPFLSKYVSYPNTNHSHFLWQPLHPRQPKQSYVNIYY